MRDFQSPEIMSVNESADRLMEGAYDDGHTVLHVVTALRDAAISMRSLAIARGLDGPVKVYDCSEGYTSSSWGAFDAHDFLGRLRAAQARQERVVIACDDGHSRAVVLAAAWIRANELDDSQYWTYLEGFVPDLELYELMLQAADQQCSAEDLARAKRFSSECPERQGATAGEVSIFAPPTALQAVADASVSQVDAAPIRGFEGDYFFLSNFYERAPLTVNSVDSDSYPVEYRNSEAAYQAGRVKKLSEERLFAILDPVSAHELAQHGIEARNDWEDVRLQRMRDVVRAKFYQNLDIAWKLVQTQGELVNLNLAHDNYWGDCACSDCREHTGDNMLGRILMDLREEMRAGIGRDWPSSEGELAQAGAPFRIFMQQRKPGYPVELKIVSGGSSGGEERWVFADLNCDSFRYIDMSYSEDAQFWQGNLRGAEFEAFVRALGVGEDYRSDSTALVDAIRERFWGEDGAEKLKAFCEEHGIALES